MMLLIFHKMINYGNNSESTNEFIVDFEDKNSAHYVGEVHFQDLIAVPFIAVRWEEGNERGHSFEDLRQYMYPHLV